MNWNILNKKDLKELKKCDYVLVSCDSGEYPYDIIQYGILDGQEYWHSFLHINSNKYEYSSEELPDLFSHYIPLIQPERSKREERVQCCESDGDERHDCAWHSTCRDMNHTCITAHKRTSYAVL